jgi:hypothetical protein
MISPFARLRDLQSALLTGNNRAAEEPKPGGSEAKTGCLGSCIISPQETHHLISQPPTRDSGNGWRDGDSSQEQEQNQVQEPIRGTVRGDAEESGQLLLVANVEAFT